MRRRRSQTILCSLLGYVLGHCVGLFRLRAKRRPRILRKRIVAASSKPMSAHSGTRNFTALSVVFACCPPGPPLRIDSYCSADTPGYARSVICWLHRSYAQSAQKTIFCTENFASLNATTQPRLEPYNRDHDLDEHEGNDAFVNIPGCDFCGSCAFEIKKAEAERWSEEACL